MSILSSFKKRSTLDAAIKQVAKARKSEGGLADQLYKGAYQGFANVILDHPLVADSLYQWGFALLHQAAGQSAEQMAATLQDAIAKFSFCLLTSPNYLGAAIDGGVAYMELARISGGDSKKQLYEKARQFFEIAEVIQKGSAAYNLACLYALSGNEEACLEALQLAKERGSLPDEQNILGDADMSLVLELQWFKDFMELVKVKAEPRTIVKEEEINLEPAFKIKKTEDFDYYS
jgi:tetratricopeptide (TPR) repeat protein